MSHQKGTILLTGANGGLGSAIVSQIVSSPDLGSYHGIFAVCDTKFATRLKSKCIVTPIQVYANKLDSPDDTHNIANGSFKDARYKTMIANDIEPLAKGTWSLSTVDKTAWAAGYRRYGASKMCGVAMIHELQRRLDHDPVLNNISVLAVDPGAMATGIVRQSPWFIRVIVFQIFAGILGGFLVRLFPNGTWRTPQKSASDVLAAAFNCGPLPLTERPKGLYLNGSEPGEYNSEAKDPKKCQAIWKVLVLRS